jgi:hypothetical protein
MIDACIGKLTCSLRNGSPCGWTIGDESLQVVILAPVLSRTSIAGSAADITKPGFVADVKGLWEATAPML